VHYWFKHCTDTVLHIWLLNFVLRITDSWRFDVHGAPTV